MVPIFIIICSVLVHRVDMECIKDGKTYSDDETWEDTTSCKKFTCIAGSPSVTFKGCPYENECMPFDSVKKNMVTCKIANCTEKGNGYRLTNAANGCIDENNKCHLIDTQWPVQKCFIKTCERISEGLVGEKLVTEGCEYENSTCLVLNERKKTSLCKEYQCQKNGMEYGIKLVKGGCEDNGTCRDEGTTWTKDCIKYECKKINNVFKADPIIKACLFKGQCKDAGSMWLDGCFKYKCNDGLYELLVGECQGKDKCHAVGAKWKEGDFEYTCNKLENVYAKELVTGSGETHVGCMVNNEEKAVGEIWEESCFKKTCIKDDNKYSTKTISGQCKLSNGTCIPEGTKWEENCFTYTCQKESDNRYATDVIQVKCKHKTDDGTETCLEDGETWKTSLCASSICRVDLINRSWKTEPQKLECEFKVGSEKRCVPKDEIGVNLKCMEYVCKITKKIKYKAQMTRKRRDKAAIGCPINGAKRAELLKGIQDDNKIVLDNCAKSGDLFIVKCNIVKCQQKRRKWKWVKIGKAQEPGC